MSTALAEAPETGQVAYRSHELVRDAVRMARMAPGTVLLLGPAIGVVAQAVAVAIAWPDWLRTEHDVAVLERVLSRGTHPSVRDVLPAAHALVHALGVGLASSVLTMAIAAVAIAAPMRHAAERAAVGLPTTLSRSLQRVPPAHARHRPAGALARLCLVTAGCAVIAAALVAALLTTRAPTVTAHVRGSILTLVVPSTWLIASVLAAISVVVVTIIPLGRAVLVTAPVQTPVDDGALTPAPGSPDALQESHSPEHATTARPEQASAFSGNRRTTFIAVILSLGATALSAAFALEAMLARPIADDYRYFADIRRLDLLAFLAHHLETDSGRYSEGLLAWIAYRLGGAGTIQWMPLVLLGFLVVATAATVRVFIPPFQALPRSTSLAFGCAASALAVTAAPSVVDSYLWFTSSTVYVPATGVLMTCCLALRAAIRQQRGAKRTGYAGLAILLVLIAQGFYEASSVLTVAAAVIFAAILAVRRDRVNLPIAVLVTMAAIAGFAMMYFAPGERSRASATGGGNLLVASLGAVYGQLQLWQATSLAAWLLVGALGLGLAVILARLGSPRTLLMVLVAGGVLVVALPSVCSFVSFYSLNWAPWRTYTLASASFCWGTVLLLGSAGALLIRQRRWKTAHRVLPSSISVIVAACTVIGIVSAVPRQAAIVAAEAKRASMMDFRDVLVQKQLAAGDRVIVVYPAPLLVYPTDARDFEFTAVQNKMWFAGGYRNFFGIPPNAVLRFVTHPPDGYCTDDPRVAAGSVRCHQGP